MQEFIARAVTIHDNIYDYTKVKYVNNYTKVEIYCKKHNIWFYQKPLHHLNGHCGCRKCKDIKHKNSCLVSLGVENPSQLEQIKQTKINTCLNNNGVKHPGQSILVKEKIKTTCLMNLGVENPSQSLKVQELKKETTLKNWGVDNPFKSNEIKEKIKQTMLERYDVDNPMKHKKIIAEIRTTAENNNRWLPKNLIPLKEIYTREVMKHTRQQPISILLNFEKRGMAGIEDAYQIDHKLSINFGFLNSIPPYIIGNINNLEMLPWKDNVIKRDKCSMTFNELINKIF